MKSRGWPNHRGDLVDISVANPAAGADWTYTIPTGQTARILSVSYKLTCSATVVVRYPMFNQWNPAAGSVDFCRRRFLPIIESEVRVFTLGHGLVDSAIITNCESRALPFLDLREGFVLGSSTTNLSGADQYSEIRLMLEVSRL